MAKGWSKEKVRHSVAKKFGKAPPYKDKKKEGNLPKAGFRGFNNQMTFKLDGVPVSADVKLSSLSAEKLIDEPEVVMVDKKGNELHLVMIDNTTGKEVGAGIEHGSKSSRVYMNDAGDIIPNEEIEYLARTPSGKLKKIDKFPRMLGGDREINLTRPITEDQADKYLIEKTYEIVGKTDLDAQQLYMYAKKLEAKDEVGVVPAFTITKSFKQYAGIVVPIFDENKKEFTLLMKLTRTMMEPQHPMGYPSKTKIAVKKEIQYKEIIKR